MSKRATVAVVNDSHDMRRLTATATAFRDRGIDVVEFDNGDELLRYPGSLAFALIMSDWHNRLMGLEFWEKLKAAATQAGLLLYRRTTTAYGSSSKRSVEVPV